MTETQDVKQDTGAETVVTESALARIGRDVIRYLPSVLAPLILAPITTAVFTRTFDPAHYGIYSVAMAIEAPAIGILIQWLLQPSARFYSEYRVGNQLDVYSTVISTVMAYLMLITLAGGVVALAVGSLFLDIRPNLLLWTGLLAFAVLQIPMTVSAQVLRSSLRGNAYLIAIIGSSVLSELFPLGLVLGVNRNIGWLTWGPAIGTLLVVPYALARCGFGLSQIKWRLDPTTKEVLKRFWKYGSPMMAWWVGSNLLSIEDRYVIAFFKGSAQVATYSVNYVFISSAASVLNASMGLALGPVIFHRWSHGRKREVEDTIAAMTNAYAYLAFCFVGGVVIVGQQAASIIIGPQFQVGLNLLVPLAVGMVFSGVASMGHMGMTLGEGVWAMATSALVAGSLNLVLNVVLVPPFGYVASGYATAVTYAVYVAFIWWQAKRFVPWRFDVPSLGRAAAVAVVATALAATFGHVLGLTLWAGDVLRTLTYLVVFALLCALAERSRFDAILSAVRTR